MSRIETALSAIEQHLATGQRKGPAADLMQLLDEMSPDEIRRWRIDIDRTIEHFLPKLRKAVSDKLAFRLAPPEPTIPATEPLTTKPSRTFQDIETLWRSRLADLRERHIFQWSTHYRDTLGSLVEQSAEFAVNEASLALEVIRRSMAEHAFDIFSKGFVHLTVGKRSSEHEALLKGLAGLDRFLDVALEQYTVRIERATSASSRRELRALASTLISGILEGFAQVNFGGQRGSAVLPRFPRTWAHYLAFMVPRHVRELLGFIEPGDIASGIRSVVLPWSEAVTSTESSVPLLPAIGQFFREDKRLEVSLSLDEAYADNPLVQATLFLSEDYASVNSVRDSAARGTHIVVASLKTDVRAALVNDVTVPQSVALVLGTPTSHISAEAISAALGTLVYERSSPRTQDRPLTHNIAKSFPLRDPFKSKFFHVPRRSVRALLNTYERSNGVRLWCSVRRSGKTTACFDLSTSAGSAAVVSQTCDSTEQTEGGHLFYDLVVRALSDDKHLAPDFVANAFRECAPLSGGDNQRLVVVLDEYETLFGLLRATASRNPDSRYTVVQPLLNQLVAFSRDNLLVLMGQQPGAHFILMDQNQLSAYVEQDPFPLFTHIHGSTTGEFCELLRKIFASRIEFDAGFADALFALTGGHPYLTVNTVVELVEWLIADRRPARSLRLRAMDIQHFRERWLTERRLQHSVEFDFFRSAASEALSDFGRVHSPWLHAVYRVLREIARQPSGTLRMSVDTFRSLFLAEGPLADVREEPEALLRTASQANFLTFDADAVTVRIPILAQIVRSAQPRLA